MKTKFQPPEVCPQCGEDVPRNARACPECGADEQTGWKEDSYVTDGVLPDDEFDYDKFCDEEFGSGPRKQGLQWLWWAVAVILLLAMALWLTGALTLLRPTG